MTDFTLTWSVQKDGGPKFGDSIIVTDVDDSFTSEHPRFKTIMDLLKSAISETYDVRVLKFPEDAIQRAYLMHPERRSIMEEVMPELKDLVK